MVSTAESCNKGSPLEQCYRSIDCIPCRHHHRIYDGLGDMILINHFTDGIDDLLGRKHTRLQDIDFNVAKDRVEFRLDEVDGRSPDVRHTLRVLSRQSHDDVGGVDTNGSTGLEIGLDTSTTASVATSADTNGRNMRSLQDDREQQHIHSFWCSSDHQ